MSRALEYEMEDELEMEEEYELEGEYELEAEGEYEWEEELEAESEWEAGGLLGPGRRRRPPAGRSPSYGGPGRPSRPPTITIRRRPFVLRGFPHNQATISRPIEGSLSALPSGLWVVGEDLAVALSPQSALMDTPIPAALLPTIENLAADAPARSAAI